ncbi:DUF3768 domain-containing protein [Methylobacterium brachythecii]|uniref:DUF3768 domain-containing protein n=1 Tax=Methylobacterium brachythecii TaxID=1176177 RepID=A0A7W6F7Z1_9HYPH|nr:DUF3768 domain-containing protein [Methylobacterium brachythecii]MBB3903636.1 hypothetical protein [Methylobacterium brachythecii]GLS44205.1 hypothetical protein GCM10007884_21930 [Methylobacterium brachythecii]
MTVITDAGRVCALNDILRRTLAGGTLMMSAGIVALGRERQLTILAAIAAFDEFDADNDPYDEHDFGALDVDGERILFKIDCYDNSLSAASPDPSDTSVTVRVLSVMLAEEY